MHHKTCVIRTCFKKLILNGYLSLLVFLTSLFCMPKREDLWNKEKCFLFHFESSFRSSDNQILNFQVFICHGVIKCLSTKNDTYFIDQLGKQTQPGNEIWPVYVTLEDNFFITKFYGKYGLETSSRPFLIFK